MYVFGILVLVSVFYKKCENTFTTFFFIYAYVCEKSGRSIEGSEKSVGETRYTYMRV
jgi:hypothetical protein